mmetsp:Transcript_3136/g.11972  ORF Transcript_3136/g.11972 Transcript_3136/m.11972 type:complete len:251 (-) Transcript_3136:372-1124(-)
MRKKGPVSGDRSDRIGSDRGCARTGLVEDSRAPRGASLFYLVTPPPVGAPPPHRGHGSERPGCPLDESPDGGSEEEAVVEDAMAARLPPAVRCCWEEAAVLEARWLCCCLAAAALAASESARRSQRSTTMDQTSQRRRMSLARRSASKSARRRGRTAGLRRSADRDARGASRKSKQPSTSESYGLLVCVVVGCGRRRGLPPDDEADDVVFPNSSLPTKEEDPSERGRLSTSASESRGGVLVRRGGGPAPP